MDHHDSNQAKIQILHTRNGVRALCTSMGRTTRCGTGGWWCFLHGKGHILWDVTVNTTYVHLINFLAPGWRDMFDTNNMAVDYLFHTLCQCYDCYELRCEGKVIRGIGADLWGIRAPELQFPWSYSTHWYCSRLGL
jgi:hypothetical protein